MKETTMQLLNDNKDRTFLVFTEETPEDLSDTLNELADAGYPVVEALTSTYTGQLNPIWYTCVVARFPLYTEDTPEPPRSNGPRPLNISDYNYEYEGVGLT